MWAHNLILIVIHQETKISNPVFLNIPAQLHFHTAVVYSAQSNICYPLTTVSKIHSFGQYVLLNEYMLQYCGHASLLRQSLATKPDIKIYQLKQNNWCKQSEEEQLHGGMAHVCF